MSHSRRGKNRSVRLPPELDAKAEAAACARDIAFNRIVVEALTHYLDKQQRKPPVAEASIAAILADIAAYRDVLEPPGQESPLAPEQADRAEAIMARIRAALMRLAGRRT